MKKFTVALLLVLFVFAQVAFAAEVGVIAHSETPYKAGPTRKPMTTHQFTITSGTNGAAYSTVSTIAMSGLLRTYWVSHDGTVTDNFDIYLVDSDGKDWLFGSCENLSSDTSDTTYNAGTPLNKQGDRIELPNGNYFVSAVGMGSTKTVYFYLTEE